LTASTRSEALSRQPVRAKPDLKDNKRQQLVRMVRAALEVIFDKPRNAAGIEDALLRQAPGAQ
jgi:hypothetical protein